MKRPRRERGLFGAYEHLMGGAQTVV